MKKIPVSHWRIFTWDYSFPSVRNRLIVFLLWGLLCSYCIETDTLWTLLANVWKWWLHMHILLHCILKWLTIQGRPFIYCGRLTENHWSIINYWSLANGGKKCSFRGHSPRYGKCGLVDSYTLIVSMWHWKMNLSQSRIYLLQNLSLQLMTYCQAREGRIQFILKHWWIFDSWKQGKLTVCI